MAIGIYVTPAGFTPEKYDTTLAQLEAAGAGAPAGRLYHCALESEGLVQVFDVWESQEAFDAFGATLIPIMAGIGVTVDPSVAHVSPVRNTIQG